jgi:hypothetical protein
LHDKVIIHNISVKIKQSFIFILFYNFYIIIILYLSIFILYLFYIYFIFILYLFYSQQIRSTDYMRETSQTNSSWRPNEHTEPNPCVSMDHRSRYFVLMKH